MAIGEMVVDVSQDWIMASSVQERFMRGGTRHYEGMDYAASCRQMRALGGDCYDFSCQADGQLTMLVGDASGKGVAAALMMASVQASLRTAALFTGSDLAALLEAVNVQACASSVADRYATLFYCVLDHRTRTLRYVNAGHNPPVVLHADRSIDWLESSGGPVGLFPDAAWEERVVRLRPGDCVLAYTDGVTETSASSGEEWGVDGLLRAANSREIRSANELVHTILEAMDDFSRCVQTDDATVGVLRVC